MKAKQNRLKTSPLTEICIHQKFNYMLWLYKRSASEQNSAKKNRKLLFVSQKNIANQLTVGKLLKRNLLKPSAKFLMIGKGKGMKMFCSYDET